MALARYDSIYEDYDQIVKEFGDIESLYDVIEEDNSEALYEIQYELRSGELETNIPAPNSRYYEADSVAAKCPDGVWVGWTYWYGGGKHGNPEEIDWIPEAYLLDCLEYQEMRTVRKFTIREGTE